LKTRSYKRLGITVLFMLGFALFTLLVSYQLNSQTAAFPGAQSATGQSSLRILAPQAGEKLAQSFVSARYAETAPASAAGTPTFRLRLDARDPVDTTSTNYDFTGLTPGEHTLTIQIVDANGTPIAGTQAEVRFVVLPQTTPGTQQPGAPTRPRVEGAALLPEGSTALPALSLIGFSLLVLGLVAGLRGRS
jgi:hypothetical protein